MRMFYMVNLFHYHLSLLMLFGNLMLRYDRFGWVLLKDNEYTVYIIANCLFMCILFKVGLWNKMISVSMSIMCIFMLLILTIGRLIPI